MPRAKPTRPPGQPEKDLLEKLLAHGCAYERPDLYTSYPVGAAWLTKATGPNGGLQNALAWCEVGVQEMHQCHLLLFTRVQTLYNRDLLFYDGKAWVGQLTPWEEAARLPEDYNQQLHSWQQKLAEPEYAANLQEWVLQDNFALPVASS